MFVVVCFCDGHDLFFMFKSEHSLKIFSILYDACFSLLNLCEIDFNNSRANKIWAFYLNVWECNCQNWEVGLFISNKHSTSNYLDTILMTSLRPADIIS